MLQGIARRVICKHALGKVKIPKVGRDRGNASQIRLGGLPRHIRRLEKLHFQGESSVILTQGPGEQLHSHLGRVFGVCIAIDKGSPLAPLCQGIFTIAVVDGVDAYTVISGSATSAHMALPVGVR